MRTLRQVRAAAALSTAGLRVACGGGGGSSPVAVDPPAITVQPVTQAVLADGHATFSVTATGSNPLFSDHFEMPGPAPTCILKNGVILVVPAAQGVSRISSVGSDVQVETLAADRVTVAQSQRRTG